jgi:N6-adenosine-specific RNA methylase IME4
LLLVLVPLLLMPLQVGQRDRVGQDDNQRTLLLPGVTGIISCCCWCWCHCCCCCRLVDEIVWVKMTVNRRLAKSHGYYLQHAKEVCMVAVKTPSSSNAPLASGVSTAAAAAAAAGEGSSSAFAASAAAVAALRGQQDGGGVAALAGRGVGSDVIFSERRGQSQKPEEIYKVIEALVPGGTSQQL